MTLGDTYSLGRFFTAIPRGAFRTALRSHILGVIVALMPATAFCQAPHSVAVVANDDGRLEVFLAGAIGQDGILHTYLQAPLPPSVVGLQWGPLIKYLPAMDADGSLTATLDGAGRLVVAWLSKNSIWISAAPSKGAALSIHRNIPSHDLRTLTAARNQDGRIEFFALDKKGILWSVAQTMAGSWDNMSTRNLGGQDLASIVVTPYRDGRLGVVALGGDKHVYLVSQTGPNNDWGNWRGLQGNSIAEVAAGPNADGRLNVAARGGDGHIYQIYETAPESWSNWRLLATGPFRSPVLLAANQDKRLELFLRPTPSGQDLKHVSQTQPNGDWSNLAPLTGDASLPAGDNVLTALPDGRLVIVSGDRPSCFARMIVQQSANSSSWISGGSISPITCAAPPPPPTVKVTLTADPDYIPVGGSTSLNWQVSNCGNNCTMTLEGRNGLNYNTIFLNAKLTSTLGSQSVKPSDTFTKYTLVASGSVGTNKAEKIIQLYGTGGSSGCTGCSLFYFSMKPPSSIFSCSNIAVLAPSQDAAKKQAEAEWVGFTATSIDYNQFVKGC